MKEDIMSTAKPNYYQLKERKIQKRIENMRQTCLNNMYDVNEEKTKDHEYWRIQYDVLVQVTAIIIDPEQISIWSLPNETIQSE
jgi:hypothetical protein